MSDKNSDTAASSGEDYAIEVENVSKYYKLHHERRNTLQDMVVGLFGRNKDYDEDFWALRDVSFKLPRGRTLGVIGRNGAGKSTLLKLVTGIIQPTTGRVRVNGRVSAMLELGTGFHPELSARDNIYLNGAIYGFTKKEMEERYESIVDFSELGKFIDTPVKHYSSGMYMRLAFAVAITVNPEILVVDEVLAVGDAAFGRKCRIVLDQMKSRGVSILFVSHNPSEVEHFCDEAVYLAGGKVVARGTPAEVLREYDSEDAQKLIVTSR